MNANLLRKDMRAAVLAAVDALPEGALTDGTVEMAVRGIRALGRPTRSDAMDEAIGMYLDGDRVVDIVLKTSVSQPALHVEIARRGLPLRRPQHGARKVRRGYLPI